MLPSPTPSSLGSNIVHLRNLPTRPKDLFCKIYTEMPRELIQEIELQEKKRGNVVSLEEMSRKQRKIFLETLENYED